jgi:predicted dehydrogenase
MTMNDSLTRRAFLGRSLSAAAGSTLGLSAFPHLLAQPGSANNQVRVAVAGIRSQGNGHIGRFQKLTDVNVVGLCDADSKILDQRVQETTDKHNLKGTNAVRGHQDVRELLDRKDIDAVVIATPNHWHSLLAIWACQAGKHVYVEKPVSHSIWEGRQMVKAARRYNRIVQAGTQQRSCPAVQECARDVQAGRFGKVLWIHCSKLASRKTIGKVTSPQEVPSHIDYNLWAGPAPMTPVMRRQFHYDWHWQWNWGDGEMGNWGIHYIDDFRHIMGWNDVPTKVVAAGGRFLWDDNGQTPNMHFALFDYDGTPLVVDIRNLPDPERGGDGGAVYLRSRGGNYIQCEDGHISISRGGGKAFDKKGKPVHQYKGDGGGAHAPNFISAIRNGSNKELNAEVEVCHLSTVLCHQANIAFRVGSQASVEQVRGAMKQHADAVNTLDDMLEQMEGSKVNLAKTPLTLGAHLTYDRKQERFVGTGADKANAFVRTPYRDGFAVKEQV